MNQRVLVGVFILAATSHADEVFRYRVERDRLKRDQRGELRIDAEGFTYRSGNGKTTLQIPLADVLEANVSDSRVIQIKTYDILKRNLARRRVYTFRLLEGEHDEELTRFLATSLRHPVIGSYGTPAVDASSLSAYHRHRLGGCHGKLQIDSTGIRFASDRPAESRTWLYSEIETVGSMNPFHFRITTLAETYNFDLKEKLPEQVHDLATRSVYRLPRLPQPASEPMASASSGSESVLTANGLRAVARSSDSSAFILLRCSGGHSAFSVESRPGSAGGIGSTARRTASSLPQPVSRQ
ncbi:MAG TPA: hypothetical protein VN442_10280 [Bryobacteraceae bacterium]|nr:hypothetical protein [Bryobacteraceae bacterium]